MTSYLRSWLTSGTSSADPPIPSLQRVSPPPSDDEDGSATETEDNDSPPAFPSLNSAQRVQTQKIPRILTDSELMPPPPSLGLAVRKPGVAFGSSNTTSSSLALPPTTTKRPQPASKKREKVALTPGHSPLDWAALKSSGADLRGVDTLMRIPPSVLKQHNKRDDAWSAFNGKVYNITPYLPFHPGGVKDLMRVAGRDGTKLFAETHAWVNVDFMLDACLVGFLVAEPSS
ncbi:cytochrome b5-like heme/steroid binding domain-containing protein [Crucibulum laeve]|uniref:Cytochrome b5-like heme/steroid binding domain-containing protein n=1 Tax=Crucibulum laeve TaxID=68775 RepID=A0A5C3M6D0_9AGAR|nr:cytochrome b5-like heme/steroid binding domain-containing protein [Crucibulum laeve]